MTVADLDLNTTRNGWFIREEDGRWAWTDKRIAAVAALTEGYEVVPVGDKALARRDGVEGEAFGRDDREGYLSWLMRVTAQGQDDSRVVVTRGDLRGVMSLIPGPAPASAPGDGENPHEMFEAFVAEAIAKSPEPLQELGRFLADHLDEDAWKTADRLLLQLAALRQPDTAGE